jgi:glycosyltransferase involved in cell wall biosynthesis
VNVVHVNSFDRGGGAAIAVRRISEALIHSGINSKILVQKKSGNERTISEVSANFFSKISYLARFTYDESYIRLFTKQERGRFSNPFPGIDISNYTLIKDADIINLHWINGGFLSLNSLYKLKSLRKPIVWTLHDMWTFTGGCHYSLECGKYLNECTQCPSLLFPGKKDISNKIFNRKRKLFNDFNPSIVTCSKWLGDEVRRSSLLKDKKVYVIPNPLNTEPFKPANKNEAREKLGLNKDKYILLIGAMNLKDKRKGFVYLINALKYIEKNFIEQSKNIELVTFGKFSKRTTDGLSYKIHELGVIKDEKTLIDLYNASDIYVAPSIQDNLPNTVAESIACGTPVVAFRVGGMPDMIEHMKNGYLAELNSYKDLAIGIITLMNDPGLINEMKTKCREKALKLFDNNEVANRYLRVYKNLLDTYIKD